VKAELPEVKKEDVKVTIKEGVLTLEGERRQEKEEKNKKFHRVERSYGQFVRCFTMPEDADDKTVQADFKDGVLNVHLAKSATAKPKAVEVKVA
jgi:HSP20 family protein